MATSLKVLTSFNACNIDMADYPDGLNDKLREEIIAHFVDYFADCENNFSCYINNAENGGADPDNFVFCDHQFIVRTAEDWNLNIFKSLTSAIAKYQEALAVSTAPLLDNTQTYELKKAAMLADNHFHPFGGAATFLENSQGYPYFKTLLTYKELEAIKELPEDYFIVTLYVH